MEVGTVEESHFMTDEDNKSQYDIDDGENEISLQKRKRSSSHSDSEGDNLRSVGDEVSEYELLQRKNLKERMQFLKNLNIDDPLQDLLTSANNKTKRTKPKTNNARSLSNLPKREPSRRIRALTAKKNGIEIENEINNSRIDHTEREPSVEVDERLSGTMKFEFSDEPLNLEDMNYSFDPNLELSSCSLTNFKGHLSCLKMVKPLKKITNKRIQSLCIHPSLSKRILLVGSASGELAMWNIDSDSKSNNVAVLSYHKAPVNCISINSCDHYKIYTTSHDGTICTVDMNNKECSNLFSTDFSSKPRHLTWHDELDANSLLITHGSGDVGVFDLRRNEISWIKCFNRSARTVQHHPLDSNYFLVSSGTTGCKIFDLRQQKKEISEMLHPKGLTSAFFSLDSTKILTTCNDNHLRIFDATSFKTETPNEIQKIAHNNHTGRWLSVFKANWFPFRSDTFITGSLREPRRMEVFDCNGSIVYNLNDEEMTTISPVIAVHPQLPIIAGGNSSGKVHLFVAPEVT